MILTTTNDESGEIITSLGVFWNEIHFRGGPEENHEDITQDSCNVTEIRTGFLLNALPLC
jgi:hypothetical protein